jgi:hypothetical protein
MFHNDKFGDEGVRVTASQQSENFGRDFERTPVDRCMRVVAEIARYSALNWSPLLMFAEWARSGIAVTPRQCPMPIPEKRNKMVS